MNTVQIHPNVEIDDIHLNDEERDILDSYERGEWTEVGKTSIAQMQEYAAMHIPSEHYLSVSLQEDDFTSLQAKASNLGISVQDLAARIIHASLGNAKEYTQ